MQTAPLEIKPIWHKKLQFVFSTCRFADFSVPTLPAHTASPRQPDVPPYIHLTPNPTQPVTTASTRPTPT